MELSDKIVNSIEKEIEEAKELETEIRKISIEFQHKNISAVRQLIVQTVLLSAAIIGILVNIGEHGILIKNRVFVVIAIFLLVFLIAYALIYLKRILEKENNDLPLTYARFSDVLSKKIRYSKELLAGPCEEALTKYLKSLAEEKERLQQDVTAQAAQRKKDYILGILIYVFIGALILILISVLPTI